MKLKKIPFFFFNVWIEGQEEYLILMTDFSPSVSPVAISISLFTLDLLAELLGFRVDADVLSCFALKFPPKDKIFQKSMELSRSFASSKQHHR